MLDYIADDFAHENLLIGNKRTNKKIIEFKAIFFGAHHAFLDLENGF